MYIYCIHLFMSLFIIPLQSVLAKVLPNLWQRRLENPLIITLFRIITTLIDIGIATTNNFYR